MVCNATPVMRFHATDFVAPYQMQKEWPQTVKVEQSTPFTPRTSSNRDINNEASGISNNDHLGDPFRGQVAAIDYTVPFLPLLQQPETQYQQQQQPIQQPQQPAFEGLGLGLSLDLGAVRRSATGEPEPSPDAASWADDKWIDSESEQPSSPRSRRRQMAKTERDRNKQACKLFREKRKREINFLQERNDQLERDRAVYRRRIAELENEAQIYKHQALQDLDAENKYLRSMVHKHRKAVADILNLQSDVERDVAIDTAERGHLLAAAVDDGVCRVLGVGYASQSAVASRPWQACAPLYLGSRLANVTYQLLPEGTAASGDHAHRINVRIDVSVERPAEEVAANLWPHFSNPLGMQPTFRGFANELELSASQGEQHGARLFNLHAYDPSAPSHCLLMAQRETQVCASALWPSHHPSAASAPEHDSAFVYVRASGGKEAALKLTEEVPQGAVQDDRMLSGAIVLRDPLHADRCHVVLLESHPVNTNTGLLHPTVEADGRLNAPFVQALHSINL